MEPFFCSERHGMSKRSGDPAQRESRRPESPTMKKGSFNGNPFFVARGMACRSVT